MKPSLVLRMRPCGSVKLRCALGAGSADDGLVGLRAAAGLLLLLDAALLVGRGLRLSLQLSFGLGDPGDPLLPVGDPVGQFFATLVAVQPVVLGICGLPPASNRPRPAIRPDASSCADSSLSWSCVWTLSP